MHYNKVSWVFPGDSHNKEPTCIAGDKALIPGLRRSSGEGNSYPTPVFLSEEFQRKENIIKKIIKENTFTVQYCTVFIGTLSLHHLFTR